MFKRECVEITVGSHLLKTQILLSSHKESAKKKCIWTTLATVAGKKITIIKVSWIKFDRMGDKSVC